MLTEYLGNYDNSIELYLWFPTDISADVSMASLTELSFSWTGFISAMTSNISLTEAYIPRKQRYIFQLNTNPNTSVLKPQFN